MKRNQFNTVEAVRKSGSHLTLAEREWFRLCMRRECLARYR